jgi:hypothetical protein
MRRIMLPEKRVGLFFVAGAFASALMVGACGQGPASNPVVGGVQGGLINGCAAGAYPSAYGCAPYSGDFLSNCARQGGMILPASPTGPTQVCRYSFSYTPSLFNTRAYGYVSARGYDPSMYWSGNSFSLDRIDGYVPRLSPDDVAGSQAFNTGIEVYPGDRLSYSVVGGWGSTTVKQKKVLGIRVQSMRTDCDKVELDGRGDNGQRVTWLGEPSGLYGTDGFQRFPLKGAGQQLMTHRGVLKIGFNTPANIPYACSNLLIQDLRVTRCFDASGNTYTCQ